ncbi:hypothetical protein C8F04DRAFT_1270379 [Mycena alexandri]|uniref:RING-type domain-containing protein n=1 Tax=Mycena alexandri TaxID=1745969 RepID=A0AAD6SBU8_9AGAR|nr:hypothetical protein C8F04DRAFT_1270379 [Mycena alexandri]
MPGSAQAAFSLNSTISRVGPPGSSTNPFVLGSSPPPPSKRVPTKRTGPTRTVPATRAARDIGSLLGARVICAPPSAIAQASRQPYPPGILGDFRGAAAPRRDAAEVAQREAAEVERARREHVEARDAVSVAAARLAIPHVVITSGIRRRARRISLGMRDKRTVPLTPENVLVTDAVPPTVLTTRAHQTCGICLHTKSHPVSYLCGHSHCYRCIRVWLEKKFTCPTCRTVMNRAPHRNYIEEEGLALDHPNFVDTSVVDYNWDGLRFPQLAEVGPEFDSE